MGKTDKDAGESRLIEQRSMWCQRCFTCAPEHAVWFKVNPSTEQRLVVGQVVCDQCLDAAVTSLAAARAVRMQLGSPCWMVEVRALQD